MKLDMAAGLAEVIQILPGVDSI
jgi:hypothetical protein